MENIRTCVIRVKNIRSYVAASFICINHHPNFFITDESNALDLHKMVDFFLLLGKAKHEPCGEYWDMSYGDSAWRMAVMCMCLPDNMNKNRLVKTALLSALTR